MGGTVCKHGELNCIRCALGGLEIPPVHVHLVLDVSPSMVPKWPQTLSGLNEYIQSLRQNTDTKFKVSLHTFSTEFEKLYDEVDPDNLPKFTKDNLSPHGPGTALYDAIGQVLDGINTQEPVIVVVLTDGEENSSSHYTRSQVDTITKERERLSNYTFVYIGAEKEAWDKGGAFAHAAANNLNTTDTVTAFTNLASATMNYGAERTRSLRSAHANGVRGQALYKQAVSYSSNSFFSGPNDAPITPNGTWAAPLSGTPDPLTDPNANEAKPSLNAAADSNVKI